MGKAIIVSVLFLLLSSFVAAQTMTLTPGTVEPEEIIINQGETVTFVNDNPSYSVLRIRTMYFTSERFEPGESTEVTFDEPGRYQLVDVVFNGVGYVNVQETAEPNIEAPQDIQEDNDFCPENYQPVCGENGQTYSNECFSELDNVGVECAGECPCRTADLPPTPPAFEVVVEDTEPEQPEEVEEPEPQVPSEGELSSGAVSIVLLIILLAIGGAFLLAGKDKKKPVKTAIPASAAKKPRKRKKK